MKNWLLIRCKARRESVVVRNLERQGFVTYSPMIRVCRSGLGIKKRLQLEPLFPGYVFMHVDPVVQSISPVRSTRGVLRFVRFGQQYASASEDLMNQIMSSVAEQLALHDRKQTFRKGDIVDVSANGFNNIKAIFSRRCGKERAMILLMILGRQARVSVPMESLSRATTAPLNFRTISSA